MRSNEYRITIVAIALVLCLSAITALALGRLSPTLEGAEMPPGLPIGTCVARSGSAGADVVMWDGAAWRPIVAPAVLQPSAVGSDMLVPRINSMVVAPDRSRLGLWVAYCGDGIEERDACTARGYVYDIDDHELLALRENTAPVAWADDGGLLVEDYMIERAAVFDQGTGTYVELAAPDDLYSLSLAVEGVSADGDVVLFSGEAGEGIVQRSTGAVTLLRNSSAHNTAWMALSPDETAVAVVDIRAGEDNRLGGGALSLFDRTGAPTATVTLDRSFLDFHPAWADGGRQLVFLRASADALRNDVLAYGSEAQNLPSAIVAYDRTTETERTLLAADAVRRDLLAPGAGRTLLFLERVGERQQAKFVPLDGGVGESLLADGLEHTAIAVPR